VLFQGLSIDILSHFWLDDGEHRGEGERIMADKTVHETEKILKGMVGHGVRYLEGKRFGFVGTLSSVKVERFSLNGQKMVSISLRFHGLGTLGEYEFPYGVDQGGSFECLSTLKAGALIGAWVGENLFVSLSTVYSNKEIVVLGSADSRP